MEAAPDELSVNLNKALLATGCFAGSGVWLKRVLWHQSALAIYAEGGSNGMFCAGLPKQPLRWLVGVDRVEAFWSF
jgi:hypothetical protein